LLNWGNFPVEKSGQLVHSFSTGKICHLKSDRQLGDLVPSRQIGEAGESDKLSFAGWGNSPPVALAKFATPVGSPIWQS